MTDWWLSELIMNIRAGWQWEYIKLSLLSPQDTIGFKYACVCGEVAWWVNWDLSEHWDGNVSSSVFKTHPNVNFHSLYYDTARKFAHSYLAIFSLLSSTQCDLICRW